MIDWLIDWLTPSAKYYMHMQEENRFNDRYIVQKWERNEISKESTFDWHYNGLEIWVETTSTVVFNVQGVLTLQARHPLWCPRSDSPYYNLTTLHLLSATWRRSGQFCGLGSRREPSPVPTHNSETWIRMQNLIIINLKLII